MGTRKERPDKDADIDGRGEMEEPLHNKIKGKK